MLKCVCMNSYEWFYEFSGQTEIISHSLSFSSYWSVCVATCQSRGVRVRDVILIRLNKTVYGTVTSW